jgi:hypothetical protein
VRPPRRERLDRRLQVRVGEPILEVMLFSLLASLACRGASELGPVHVSVVPCSHGRMTDGKWERESKANTYKYSTGVICTQSCDARRPVWILCTLLYLVERISRGGKWT